MQKIKNLLGIFLCYIWKEVLTSHDDDKALPSHLLTKQDVIQQVLETSVPKSADSSALHLRNKTEKAFERIMFVFISEGILEKFHFSGKALAFVPTQTKLAG